MIPRLVVHGGAGTFCADELTTEKISQIRAAIGQALTEGYEVLRSGGSSLDAVEIAVRSLENCSLFNAAKGAVLTSSGTVELDASIMDGATLNAGGVACVRNVRNPISLARAVMERSEHVLLVADGAEAFARQCGLEFAEQEYFITQERRQSLFDLRAQFPKKEEDKHGTVGAVALDSKGNLAAATSTGGRTNKHPGRVGDSPLIGAGTYANRLVAISGTGHGEHFIRHAATHTIAALMEFTGMSLEDACQHLIFQVLPSTKGAGGVVAIDHTGAVATPFNTPAMVRGRTDPQGTPWIAIQREPETPLRV